MQPNAISEKPRALQGLREGFHRYESHLSAAAMLVGFAIDNVFFKRIDIPSTQVVFTAYIIVAAASIVFMQFVGARAAAAGRPPARWHAIFSVLAQFSLGGLWSGFLIFYGRSATLAVSWPFVALLAAILIGNEVFRRHLSRLIFSAVLLFFAMFSYAIFMVPIYAHAIGTFIFLISGAIALVLFWIFMGALRVMSPHTYAQTRVTIIAGAAFVFAALNAFYFLNILPPLPLALSDAGVYHSVKRQGGNFVATGEPQSWRTKLGWPAIIHNAPGKPLSVYSAIFAPIKLSTEITHRWQFRDPKTHRWSTKSAVTFPIMGGRDGVYRGYSVKGNPQAGDWRVDIETIDGRIVGRVKFTVIPTMGTAPETAPKILK
ncbi:MAG TPA: DUF2914 domain-containing protein [Rhizomicrobium sp.]|nr:DUF2914 domain-containing protein [Rhizomicrobium sp.]